jgi:hypothetical protein
MMRIEIDFYAPTRSNPWWTAHVGNAVGAGSTSWKALAVALEVWNRRGRPASKSVRDWVITRLVDNGRGEYYRWSAEGVNLNFPPDHPDHILRWRLRDLDDEKRYELLGDAQEIYARAYQDRAAVRVGGVL